MQENVDIAIAEEKLKAKNKGEEFNINEYRDLNDFTPTIESKYSEIIGINNGEIYIKLEADDKIKEIALSLGFHVSTEQSNAGGGNIVIGTTTAQRVKNYKIYGNSVQESDNLFDKATMTLTDNLYLTSEGVETSNTRWKITDYIEVNGYEFTLTNVGGNAPSVCAYDENKNLITGVRYGTANADTKTNVRIASETLIKYIRFSIYHVWVADGSINNIKLQHAPTPDAPIEIASVGGLVTDVTDANYGKYKIPITVSGKNLIPYPYYMGVTNPYYGIEWKVNNDGSITLNGTATGNVNIPLISMSAPVTFKKGTYTISGNNIQDSGLRLWFREVGSGTVLTSAYNGNAGKLTLTKDSNMYVYITVNNGVTLQNATIYPLLEVGDTATEYEPYVHPVTTNIYLDEPLRKIGDYADYIDFENGKVFRRIVKNIMTGTEEVGCYYNVNDSGYMWIMLARTRVVEAYCSLSSHFKTLPGLTLEYVGEGISANTNATYIIISINTNRLSGDLTTTSGRINASKEWFAEQYEAGNPVEIYYVSKTPDDTENVNLPEMSTFAGTSIISVGTEIAPSNVVIEY